MDKRPEQVIEFERMMAMIDGWVMARRMAKWPGLMRLPNNKVIRWI